jgi:hypothetical protein
MRLKQADDKSNDIEVLESLLQHPQASAQTKAKIKAEIWAIRAGAKGEKDVAYEIDFRFAQSKNWVVIHDLRVVHKGRVAQIDHLVFNRFLDVWVCESKRFKGGIAIDEHGECTTFINSESIGISSPYEQNRKHIEVLKAICNDGAIDLPSRLGFAMMPKFHNYVVLATNAPIDRPKAKGWWNDGLVKADQLISKIEKTMDDENAFASMAKLVGQDTLELLALSFNALHTRHQTDWHGKFGLPKIDQTATTHSMNAKPQRPAQATAAKPQVARARECAACNVQVEEKVATFCLKFNKRRFGGKIYCRDCQENFPKPS